MLEIGDKVKSKATDKLYIITKLPEENRNGYHAERNGINSYVFFLDEIEKVDSSYCEEMEDKSYDDNGNEIISEAIIGDDSSPYLEIERTVKYNTRKYNPKYGDKRICKCGHTYYRHFDSWEDMRACGCKYCGCDNFEEDS